MSDNNTNQNIIDALESVEHPSIAATLLNLGILRDLAVADDQKVMLTLALPFPNIPDNIRDYMVTSRAAAAQSGGGQLLEVNLALMNDEERQNFLTTEQQNWRG
jgi:metal-sulfur cluster biosynthetic enzyme